MGLTPPPPVYKNYKKKIDVLVQDGVPESHHDYRVDESHHDCIDDSPDDRETWYGSENEDSGGDEDEDEGGERINLETVSISCNFMK